MVESPSDASTSAETAKSGKREWYYGYDVEALVRVPHTTSASSSVRSAPILTQVLVVQPASTDFVKPCLGMLNCLIVRDVPGKALLVDRHDRYKKYRRWFRQLLKRGIG